MILLVYIAAALSLGVISWAVDIEQGGQHHLWQHALVGLCWPVVWVLGVAVIWRHFR